MHITVFACLPRHVVDASFHAGCAKRGMGALQAVMTLRSGTHGHSRGKKGAEGWEKRRILQAILQTVRMNGYITTMVWVMKLGRKLGIRRMKNEYENENEHKNGNGYENELEGKSVSMEGPFRGLQVELGQMSM